MGEVVAFDPRRLRPGKIYPPRKGRPIRHIRAGIIGETRELAPDAFEAVPYVNGRPGRRLGLYTTKAAAAYEVARWFTECQGFGGSTDGGAA